MNRILKYIILFIMGGNSYFYVELLWRGYSHITMFFLGGLCFVLIGLINEIMVEMPLLMQQVLSALIISTLELVFGMVFNMLLGMNIWDYSNLKLNFMGQISLAYSFLWFFLSLPAIIFDDYLRYWIFGEEKPQYSFYNRTRI